MMLRHSLRRLSLTIRRTTSVRRPLALAAVGALSASALVSLPSTANAAAIEGYAPYQPQTICSPTAKPGTLKLAAWLTNRYPGTASSGIVRGCTVGGRSEHKEGRAFDWRLNVANATQARQAAAFLREALATDSSGNRHARARRMGVMYIIWADRIYSASSGFAARPYVHSACAGKPLTSCGATLRHRDHMHISLGWSGALAKTSFFTGRVAGVTPSPVPPAPRPAPRPAPKPAPKPAPRPAPKPAPRPAPKPSIPVLDQVKYPVVSVTVPATGRARATSFALRAGRTYRFIATGHYRYGVGARLADAACSWRTVDDRGWSRASQVSASPVALKLTVNGGARWKSTSGGPCSTQRHAYYWDYTPSRTGPVTLRLVDLVAGDNVGGLTWRVTRAGTPVGSFTTKIPAAAPEPVPGEEVETEGATLRRGTVDTVTVSAKGAPALTSRVLREGRTYVVVVKGTYDAGDGIIADAECSKSPKGTWRNQRTADPLHTRLDHFDVYVDGADLRWGSQPCRPDHTYTYVVAPRRDGRLPIQVWDPRAADNAGGLTVALARTPS